MTDKQLWLHGCSVIGSLLVALLSSGILAGIAATIPSLAFELITSKKFDDIFEPLFLVALLAIFPWACGKVFQHKGSPQL